MRQIGLLAAAANHCLDTHLPLLKLDEENASYLASELVTMGFSLSIPTETNMVWLDTSKLGLLAEDLSSALAQHGIIAFGGKSTKMRLVVHHQINREAIDLTLKVIRDVVKKGLVRNRIPS
jgi:threonine aldolase